MLGPAHLPGWDAARPSISQAYGEAWQTSRRSLLLLVPSVVARMELNVLINFFFFFFFFFLLAPLSN